MGLLIAVAPVGAAAAEVAVRIHDQDGRRVDAAVVALVGAGTGAAPRHEPHVMDQVDKRFVPKVLAIRPGEQVRFPNSDDIRHHVYSFSEPKVFELPLYSGEPADPVRFDRPGKIVLGCNIHDRMAGYIYVIPAAHLSVARDGIARFESVPPGQFSLRVHHPALPADAYHERAVAISDTTTLEVALRLPAEPQPQQPKSELSPVERRFRELRHAFD